MSLKVYWKTLNQRHLNLKIYTLKQKSVRIFSFEKLNVWQQARQLSIKIYTSTKNFPAEEKFGLTSQMRRAAISISSNIAEGTGRHTFKDKARFTEIAYSSTLELLNQSILANDLKFYRMNYTRRFGKIFQK